MLKTILFLMLSVNLAFASRFEEADKKKFIEEVKQEIAQHKLENKGKVDLQIIKPEFYRGLDEYHAQEKFTKDEMLVIKQRYENFSRDKSITPQNAEASFYKFLEIQLEEINQRPLPKVKEGQICNNWSCDKGLRCAPDPVQDYGSQCRKTEMDCKVDADCCSNECIENPKTNKKVCEDVYRCFRPLNEGQACNSNPVCGVGSCLPFDSLTAGIGECEENMKACKKNSDCCSNLCGNGVCRENYICKDCVPIGKSAERGKKCCEGLYPSEKGICIPDVPPTVIPQVKVSPVKSFIIGVVNLFITTAQAADPVTYYNFIDSSKEGCEESILSRFEGKKAGTCTIGGGCGIACGIPGSTCVSGNPQSWGFCTDGTVGLRVLSATVSTNEDDSPSTINTESTLYNVVAATKEDCEKAISDVITHKTGTCTLGGGCGTTCGKPSSTCVTANPTSWGLCTDGKDLAYLPGYEPKTEEQIAGEENDYLNKQGDIDTKDIVSTIKGDPEKYGYGFQAKSDKFTPNEKKIDNLKVTRKSNFDTCEIRFKDDFMTYLQKNNLLELEMALLGFDFVMSGDGVNDYWTSNGNESGSIYARLKEASKISKEQRAKLWETVEKTNKELTCMCLDAQGLKNIKLPEKKEFFIAHCAEYAKYLDPNTKEDELYGDASGVKGKRLLVAWTSKLAEFNRSLVVDHGKVKDKVSAVLDWMADDQKWSETTTKTHTLFNFNIKNPSGSAAALGAVLGAVLAAGVIAIMGGFGTASILTAWGVAGIITASAVTGAGGLWMISSLRGAWITKKPEIMDRYVRSYGCGKKETCVEYSRELIQPYNDICKVNTSANACVKDFMVIRETGLKNESKSATQESTFLVDPWVPYNVPKSLLIKDSINGETYAQKLDRGFFTAKAAMIAKNPGASGGGGKKGGGEFVPESYLTEVFLDPTLVGQYVPQLGNNLEEKYFLRDKQIQVIKKAAIEFALEQKFFEPQDTENLNIFAEYSYQYHFVYPKRSRLNEISYPAVGLKNYVDLIANKVIGVLSANAVNAVGDSNRGFTNLNLRYLEDYYNTLGLYDKSLNQSETVKKAALKKEMDAVGAEIERLRAVSAMISNPALDSAGAFAKGLLGQSNTSGGKSGLLTAGDMAYLQAVGKLRADRKNQLKKLDRYKKAIATIGNKDRAERMNKAAIKFGAKFTKPISTAGSSKFGSNLAETVLAAEENAGQTDANANMGAGQFNSGANASFSNVSPSAGGMYGAGSSSSAKSGDAAGGGYGSNGMSDEDRKRLADAIDARNKANKEKYQSKDGQTLFEKVTNAYIRNYDKVLSKKKDKDVIESK